MIAAVGALVEDAELEDQRFQDCLQEKGYMISGF
jgi:hypothetical protein